MRNLQKILALALALIMSFSLVVTANAAFSDEADITDTYNEAVNVLSQLEVFKGYTDGTYQPQKSITRAEVAAIIYRIATGDVTDTQVSIYSDWNRFTDVHAGEWWAGYINYCANAEYIKGYGNGKFGPDDPVTGYEALAMILRAVGYGKMDGEFQGSDWAVQTAARANTLKVTKNVQNSALLNSAATRELVAELLFRSILVPTVEYNQFSGYSENDTTLAYQSFGLERIEGVVVANEYADLYSTQVLNEGKTDLQEANGTIRSLDITSALTDIGESRYAYIIDSAHGAKVLGLEDTGSNVVFEPENGKGTKIEGSNFQKNTGLRKDDDTEFYLNFGREGKFSCDQRLEFQVVFYTEQAYKSFVSNYEDIGAYAYKCQLSAAKDDDWTVERGTFIVDTDNTAVLTRTDKDFSLKDYAFPTTGDNNYVLFNRIVRANEEITAEEMDIIEGIFAAADNILGNGQPRDQVTGDVYLGTKSNIDKDDKERDVSNEISFRKFKDEYINSEIWDQDIENSGNGEWLKVVDYNNDGVAEYAFLTEYTLDKAISSYTKSGETILEFNSMDIENIEDNDGIIDYTEEISVGDVVYYTKIDNRYTITKSPVVKATIQTVTFKDDSCTTTDGETYTESDIDNESRLDQLVANMEDKVEYNLYFDAYGWLRAYELANGNTYGLLTELYRTTSQNVQYVKGEDLTVELKKGDAKIDEFGVDNSKDNVFLLNVNRSGIAANNWANLERDILALSSHAWYKNVYSTSSVEDPSSILLQPAIGQLGLEYAADGRSAETAMRNVTTNVAVYTETADGEVRLTSPVKLAKDVNGNQYYYVNSTLTGEKTTDTSKVVDASGNRLTGNALDARKAYQVDYIELDLSDGVEADAKHYPIADSADNHSRYQYQNGSYNNYVDAVHDTEFYVVNTSTKEKIDHFVDYEKVYALKAEDIVAAYAVARNIESDYNKSDYWVADVIVIEVSNIDAIYDSVGVFYNNPSQTSGNVKRIETLNTESENPEIEMVLDGGRWDWHPRDNGNWAYEIDENEVKDGILYADSVKEIDKNYNAKGLYAGTVTRMRDIKDRGGYIDVLMSGTTELSALKAADGKPVPAWTRGISVNNDILFAIGATNGASGANTTTRSLRVTYNAITNRLEEQHRIIWGEDKDGHVAFVIDVDFRDGDWCAPSWLTAMDTNGLWYAIASEQVANRAGYTFAEALEAYLGWKAGTVDKADALSIIASAKTHKDTTDKQAAQLKQMEDEINGKGTGTATTPEEIARELIKAKNAFKAAYDASTATDKDADPNVVAAAEALRKAATAYAKLTTAQKNTLPGTDGVSSGTHNGLRKAAEDAMGISDNTNYGTIAPALKNAAAIADADATDKNKLDDAEKALKNIKDAEKALATALDATFAKKTATAQKLVDDSKAIRAAMEAIKTAADMENSMEYSEAELAPYKQAAVDAYQKLTASQKTALDGMGWTVDSTEVNDSSELKNAVTGWIAAIPVDAEIKSVKLKDTLKTLKIEQDANGDYIISNIPAGTTLTSLTLGDWVVVEKTGGAVSWAADNAAVDDYDATYVITVKGTGTPDAGEDATVNVYFKLNKAQGDKTDAEKQAEADILKNEIQNVKTTTNTEGQNTMVTFDIGGEDTAVTSNIESFNEVYTTDDGDPLFEGVTSPEVVAMIIDLSEYVNFGTNDFQVVQVNKALNKAYGNGTFANDTKTKDGYTLNNLKSFAFMMMTGEDVIFTITAKGTADAYDGPSVTIRINNNVTVVSVGA